MYILVLYTLVEKKYIIRLQTAERSKRPYTIGIGEKLSEMMDQLRNLFGSNKFPQSL